MVEKSFCEMNSYVIKTIRCKQNEDSGFACTDQEVKNRSLSEIKRDPIAGVLAMLEIQSSI